MVDPVRTARDLEEFEFQDGGQEWIGAWHPPRLPAPEGMPHGSAAICFTVAGQVVLVSEDGKSWTLPGGRPIPGEDWRATLKREVLEEACARVDRASLLGFVRGVCVKGRDEGVVKVRSLWLAHVTLLTWEPRHEIRGRSLVRPDSVLSRVDHPAGLRPVYRRWIHEAMASDQGTPSPGQLGDQLFSDPDLAGLYDAQCEGRPDFAFYLPLVMSANSVLDVGCGTGQLLRLAREAGHRGRLCGLDPAAAMLQIARRRPEIEWVLGKLGSRWNREFDLVVMTGHAFQVFLEDAELLASLAAIRSALTDQGRFVFETRNPLVREWEAWTPDKPVKFLNGDVPVRMSRNVETPVEGDLVSFTLTYTSPNWDGPRVSRSTLRFLDRDSLSSFLTRAGLAIDQQFGDWDCQTLTDSSPEIITVARRL